MKKVITKSILLLAILSIAACSSTPVRRSFKETWKDTMTAQKVRYKLMRDKDVKKSHMHVEVYRGEVTLTGRAVSPTEKARAETLAKSVKNVTGVDNYIHVVESTKSNTAVATAAPVAPEAIKVEEKVIVKEEVLVSASNANDTVPVIVPTVREATGKPSARVASRSASKSTKVARKSEDDKPAAIRKVPVKTAAPAEPAQVVGEARTGLPWDGAVYEDDVSSVKPAVKAAPVVSSKSVATRTSDIKEKSADTTSNSQPIDDLAREAAQELEKLRSKR